MHMVRAPLLPPVADSVYRSIRLCSRASRDSRAQATQVRALMTGDTAREGAPMGSVRVPGPLPSLPGRLYQRAHGIGLVALLALALAGTVAGPVPASAQSGLVVTPLDGCPPGTLTSAQLVATLLGEGISSIGNVTYIGASCAAGTFSGGNGIIGFNNGIILSSGQAAHVVGPNTSGATSTSFGT